MKNKQAQYEITHFSLKDMSLCGKSLRGLVGNAGSMEEAAKTIIRYLYDSLVQPGSHDRACSLIRFFVTSPFSYLDEALMDYAAKLAPNSSLSPQTRCLTLIATAGDEPAWNLRRMSRGHRALPLISEAMMRKSPMIAQLIQQMGMQLGDVLNPSPELILNLSERNFGVFYVPEALGSPEIPAQKDFVIPYGIRSVLGFGGMLPSGNIFAVIIFSKSFIPRETAEMFQTVALSIKFAILPLTHSPLFQTAIESGKDA